MSLAAEGKSESRPLTITNHVPVAMIGLSGMTPWQREGPPDNPASHCLAFHQLLEWLDPDPDGAGREYESIRRKLISFFGWRGCRFPDELADEVFDRVAKKIWQIKPIYDGSRLRYFYGVARRVALESHRAEIPGRTAPPDLVDEEFERSLQRLDWALTRLKKIDRDLILSYYGNGDSQKHITHRRLLSKQFGLTPNALRTRVHRIRIELKEHLKCAEAWEAASTSDALSSFDMQQGHSWLRSTRRLRAADLT